MKKNNIDTNEIENLQDEENVQEEPQVEEPQVESEEKEAPDQLDQLSELQEQLAELKDAHLRLMAEYDNYRKRTLKEKSDLIKSAGEGILSSFLEVADDMDRAQESMQQADDVEALKEGVDIIINKFISTLKRHGVNEVATVGEEFDPDIFEAVAMVPVEDDQQKGKVIECVKKGYKLNDKVLRHPKVVVGN